MISPPIAVLHSGVACGVGLTAPSACAAIRASLNNFQASLFLDQDGEPIVGSFVPLEKRCRGRLKLVKMLKIAVEVTGDTWFEI